MCWFTALPGCYVTWLSLPQRLALGTHYPGLRAGQALVGILIKTPREITSVWLSLEMAWGWPQTLGPNLVLGSAPERTHPQCLNYPDGSSCFKDHKGPSRQEQTPGLASSKNVFLWNPSRMEIAYPGRQLCGTALLSQAHSPLMYDFRGGWET